jgi:hypothetical protein
MVLRALLCLVNLHHRHLCRGPVLCQIRPACSKVFTRHHFFDLYPRWYSTLNHTRRRSWCACASYEKAVTDTKATGGEGSKAGAAPRVRRGPCDTHLALTT